MGDLFEVVFRRASPLLTDADVMSAIFGRELESLGDVADIVSDYGSVTTYRLQRSPWGARVSGVAELVMLRVLRDVDEARFEVNFDVAALESFEWQRFVSALRSWAEGVAARIGECHFYGGMEPAEDPKTRVFTGAELGPLADP